jgi:hypothetical protein
MQRAIIVAIGMLVLGTALAGEASVKFTKKPAAKRNGKNVKIEFAVDRNADVAVFIEDAKGNVVRHLVAGVLGKNPPKPLKPGLVQSLEWDGRADYGKPARGGPFKVRVALGLGAKYDRVLFEEPQNFSGIKSLATAPDGTLYVVGGFGVAVPNWGGGTDFRRRPRRQVPALGLALSLESEEGAGLWLQDLRPRRPAGPGDSEHTIPAIHSRHLSAQIGDGGHARRGHPQDTGQPHPHRGLRPQWRDTLGPGGRPGAGS